MNSKKLNIVLVAAVIAVWAVVIYKYFIQSSESPLNMNLISMNEKKDFVNDERKDFELIKLKRDPFLGKTYVRSTQKKEAKKSISTRKKKTPQKNTKKKFLYEPVIEYLGFVKNDKNTKKLVILKVEGNTEIIKEETKFKDLFYVKKAHRDSVEIIVNNITKIYKKAK